MPQCPHCQTQYEQGQRDCSTCGSFLLHPEEGDTFCPQCGVRVSPRQDFCHECDAPLKAGGLKPVAPPAGEDSPARPPEAAPPAPPKGQPPWVIGSLAAAGIVIIILLILLFSRTSTPPSPPAAVAPPAPAPQAAAPAAPAPGSPAPAPTISAPPPAAAPADLKEELQGVLSKLREAQLKKNINDFMALYSSTFPNADQKRKDVLAAWQNFDYSTLVFTVDKVQAIDANNALAWVTWYMDIRNLKNQELSSASQSYQVRFVKEDGNWRIRELKEVQ